MISTSLRFPIDFHRPKRLSFSTAMLLLLLLILGMTLASCTWDPKALKARYEKEGLQALKQGKINEAIIDFENLVKLAPGSPRAHDLLAKAFRTKGWIADAVIQEEEAVKTDPRFVPGLLFLARYGYRSGQLRISLVQARKVLEVDPKNVSARVLEIRMTLFAPVKDNHEKARKELETLLVTHPQSVPALLALGDLDLLDRRIDRARLHYQAARTFLPASPDAFVGLGNCALAEGKIPEARADFKKAWILSDHGISEAVILANFDVQRGHVKKAIALLKGLSKKHLDARVPMKIGEYELLLGQTAEARRELEPLTQAHLDIPELHADLATADLQEHKEQAAYDELTDILARAPGNVRVRTVMARIQQDEGHPDKALDLLRPLRISPSLPPETWILWARLNGQEKHLHKAMEKVARGIEENPGSLLLKFERMQILAARKQWKEGLSESDAFLREFPRDRAGILEQVFFLERLHQSAQALAVLRDARKSAPADPSFELAELRLMESGKKGAEIRKSARTFLEANPKDLSVRLWLADFEMRRGHKNRALVLWRAVRTIDPANLPASLTLARIALAGPDPAKAETILGPALSAHPSIEELYVLLGEALKGTHHPEKAAEEFSTALRISPGDVRAQWELATLDFALNRADEAKTLLLALQKTPGLATPFRARIFDLSGLLDLRSGDLGKGKEAMLKAVRLKPRNPSYLESLGEVEAALGEGVPALESLTKALANDPKNARLRIVRDRVDLGLQIPPSPRKRTALEKETRDYLVRHPGSSLALQTLFDLALSAHDSAEAQKELVALEKVAPNSPDTLSDQARLALRTNQLDKARKLFEQVALKDPGNLGTLRALAALAASRKDLKDEKVWLSRILSENPGDLPSALSLASIEIVEKEFGEVRSVLSPVLSRHPDLPEAEVLLAQAELGAHKPGQAQERLSSLIKRFPSDGSLYLLRGEAEEEAKRAKEAAADYQAAIRRSPKNPVGYNNLAFLLAKEGKELPRALRLVRKSRALVDTPVSMDTEGVILSRMGVYPKAEALFSRALKNDNPAVLIHMAENEERMGDLSKALRHDRKALQSPALSRVLRLKVEEKVRRIEAKQEEARKNALVINP